MAAASRGRRSSRRSAVERSAKALAALAVLAVALLMPRLTGEYVLGLVTLMAIYAVVLMAWNLVFGYAGVITFGQMAFFAVGGYAASLANLHWGWSPWVDIWFGGVVAGLAGALVGAPSLRLFGPYMVIFTLAFQLALAALMPAVWIDVTGGSGGLTGIDVFTLGGWDYLDLTWYVSAGVALLTFMSVAFVLRSPMGIALDALREGRTLAEARGVSFFQHRILLFVLSAFLTGVAGGLYAHAYQIITPSVLDIGLLIDLFAMLVLGGLATRLGPVVGAIVGVYLTDRLAAAEQYSQLIWGLIIIVVVMLAPGGIMTTISRLLAWVRDRIVSLSQPRQVAELNGLEEADT